MAEAEKDVVPEVNDLDERMAALEKAERAIDGAYTTGKAERAKITQMAQLDAAEAVAMAGIAMEADEEADEAMRIAVIAEKSRDRDRAKAARKREREARKKANADHEAATKSAKKAYDAIKYSAPNKMGFMRVVQVCFAVHIVCYLVWLMLMSRDSMIYNMSSIMDWVMVILEGVAFWMFINRYKIARPFVIAMAVIGIVVPAIYDIATGQFNPLVIIGNGMFYIFLIFYFALSSRVKATLVNDFSQHKGDFDNDDFVIDRRGWPFVRNLIIYFIVFSIVGHWMEMGMCQFIIMGWVQGEYDPTNTMLWRDVLYPFPMEGAAVVVIGLVLYPFFQWLKKKFPGKKRILAYVISFLAGALLCSLIEFSMGLIVNADLQLWDYRDNFCNFMGQVCLQNTLAFGVVASIITWWVYPLLERWIARIPRDIMNIVFVVIVVFGAIVWSLYLINPPWVDEQNKPADQAVEVAQKEEAKRVAQARSEVSSFVSLLQFANETLRASVNASTGLTEAEKTAILAEIDKVAASTKAINDEIVADASGEGAQAAGESASASAASPAADGGASSESAASASGEGSSAASDASASGESSQTASSSG